MLLSRCYSQIGDWRNLLLAYRKAAKGKRGQVNVAHFEHQIADKLLQLQTELKTQQYRSGNYVHFYIHEPKRRKISAAPFRDRVVHHALCNIIEPGFEQRFIADSYANRQGKGTHRAIDRLQQFSRVFRYVLRIDIVKHFPSIDHEILCNTLSKYILEDDVMQLVRCIISSGNGIFSDEYAGQLFPDDDLLALCRARGLPIGNLTSQFWSNCFMNPFDHFVKRELRCRAYLRYVDDMALFSDKKQELWAWKRLIIERLARMRLMIHESCAQVSPVNNGIPWLGFIVYPTHRRVKSRHVHQASRRLGKRFSDYQQGKISFAELDASVKGWVNHVRYADSWGLRRHVFASCLR